jgi:DNA-binding response OmpR family regulator
MSRILLADDSPHALRLAEQILTAQGIEVVSVSDGAIALRRLADASPDLLITDVFLPTQSGFDLARFIKAQSAYKHIPIVFAAAPADKFEEQDAKNAGADAILRKPFEASALLAAVQPLLERSQAARNGNSASATPLDRRTVRAAVTLAIDAAMPMLIDELTERVLFALARTPGLK